MRNIINHDESTSIRYHEGAVFMARRVPDAPKFTISAFIETGAFDDVVPGTAHCFEHLPFQKSAHFENDNVSSYMRDRGGYISAATGHEHTEYFGEVLKGHERDAIHAVSDIACRAVLTRKEFYPERTSILDEWAFNEMDFTRNYSWALSKAAYSDELALRSIIGTNKTISRMKLRDVEEFRANNYFSDRLIVAMEGDFEQSQVLDWAVEKFKLPRGAPRVKRPLIPITPQTHVVRTPQRATKTSVIFQGRLPTTTPNDHAAFYILGRMLLDMTGPLLYEMRMRKRLVYSVNAPAEGTKKTTIYAFDTLTFDTHPNKTTAAIEAFGLTINRFLEAPDANLFGQIRNNVIHAIRDALKRNPEAGADNLAYGVSMKGTLDAHDASLKAYEKISLDNVMAAAKRQFDFGRTSVLYIGQYRKNYPDHERVRQLIGGPTAG